MKNILFCVFYAFIDAKSKWHLAITPSTKIASIFKNSITICKYKINKCLYVVNKFIAELKDDKHLKCVDKIITNSKNASSAITNFKNT